MGLKNGAKLSIWEVKKCGKYTDIQASTRKKNNQTGEWETDFSGYIRLVGNANTKATDFSEGKLQNPIKIEVGGFEVTQKYSKEHKKTFTNFVMYDFEMEDTQPAQPKPSADDFIMVTEDADMPFV